MTDLVPASHLHAILQVAGADLLGAPNQLVHRPGDGASEDDGQQGYEGRDGKADTYNLVAQGDDGREGLRLIHLGQDDHVSLRQPAVGAQDRSATVVIVVGAAVLAPQAGFHPLGVYRRLQGVVLAVLGLGDEEVELVDQVGILGGDQVAAR